MSYQFQSQGLLKQKLEEQLAKIDQSQSQTRERDRNDLFGFDQNIPLLSAQMKSDQNFGTFDLRTKREIHLINIGVFTDEDIDDFFDDLRVSKDVPFAVMNRDRHKIERKKNTYLSKDRRFKLYHSRDSDMPHNPFIENWSQKDKLNEPLTMLTKILLLSADEEVVEESYVDVVYRYGKGLFLESKRELGKVAAQQVVAILANHLSVFKPKLGEIDSVTGSFVVDRMLIDPFLFRDVLIQPYDFGRERRFRFSPFLWINEKGQSLAVRKQLILKFELGDIKAKILISRKQTKSNHNFFLNGIPYKFKEGTLYNLVTISKLKDPTYAQLIKDLVSIAFYLYGFPNRLQDGNFSSNSIQWAQILNYMIMGNRAYFQGAIFGPSKRITTEEIKQLGSNIKILRTVDPSFYGSIPTGKPTSNGQPMFVVSTTDPQWPTILANVMSSIANDPQGRQRQVIRYPLQYVGKEEFAQPSVTKVPPYFLIGNAKKPFFNPKVNRQPVGGYGTYHPYLPRLSSSSFLIPPGGTLQEKYAYLADLTNPFVVNIIDKPKSDRAERAQMTVKILQPGATGHLPAQLERILNNAYQHGGVTAQTDTPSQRYTFIRRGITDSTHDSLLHLLVEYSARFPDWRNGYVNLNPDQRIAFINQLRVHMASRIDFNCARQELFDMETFEIKDYFSNPATPIDSKLFKAILEKFFNVYLLVLHFEDLQAMIEIPRNKFFYIPPTYPADVQPIVVFKHRGSESFRTKAYQYEYVQISRQDGQHSSSIISWDFKVLQSIFSKINRTIDVSFSTLHLERERQLAKGDLRAPLGGESQYQTGPVVKTDVTVKPMLTDLFRREDVLYQFVDGAGKMRCFICRYHSPHYPSGRITVACEPLCPLDMQCFDDPALIEQGVDVSSLLGGEDFQKSLEFIHSLGVKAEDIAYRMDSQALRLVEEVIEEVETDSDREKRIREEREKERLKQKAAAVKTVSAMERILGKKSAAAPLPPPPAATKTATTTTRKERRVINRVVSKEVATLAIGIWFKFRGVQFYIATEPGEPPESRYSINNSALFQVDPEMILFRQHDYYERVANIIVQLLRNLYLYFKVQDGFGIDDPKFFINAITTIDPDIVYNIQGVRRRISASRQFKQDLMSYAQQFPSFFTPINEKIIAGKDIPRLILDSERTKKSLLAHLQIIQKLKEDIVGASGSYVSPISAQYSESGRREVEYELKTTEGLDYPRTIGITDAIVEKVVRMKEFYERPGYIEEFFVYPSDFSVRGPDQNIFLSSDEIREYLSLLDMEKPNAVITAPLLDSHFISRSPLYYMAQDGSLFILQNVLGGSVRRAASILNAWDREKINLGFFAEEWNRGYEGLVRIRPEELLEGSPQRDYMLIESKPGMYSAMVRLSGTSNF